MRDTESRTRFLGYRPERYKLVVWVVSAVMAAIGGALYVPQVGIINPGEFAPANSIEAVIWVAVGGRGTLTGAILGAVLVNAGKTYLTGALPEVWLFALGALFILVTLFRRCRAKPICPVAQNTQPIAQPACVLRQAVCRPG